MKSSLFKSFFSSGVQAIAVQVLGVLFFLIAARYLSKDDFGIISWVNATSVIITTIIGFGLEQVVIRRIAASKTSDWAAAAYLFHAFFTSALSFAVLVLIGLLFTPESAYYVKVHYLPWFFAAQAIVYMGLPLKQFLNAKQIFTPYAVIAILSNVIKLILAFVFIAAQKLSITMMGIILAICALIELVSLMVYLLAKTDFKFRFRPSAYYKLVKESFPQYVSSLFDVSLSRLDWILLGLIGTAAATADYSVAYRAFEVSRLPISVIAPVILSVFARMFIGGNVIDDAKKKQIRDLYSIEIFVAVLVPLCLNIVWESPLVDMVFKGKYGSANATILLILSLCIPLLFIINLLWTLVFSVKKYKQISFITFSSAICNLLLNLVLISKYGGTGAAIAFLVTVALQLFLYYRLVHKYVMTFSVVTLIVLYVIAAASYVTAMYVTDSIILQLVIAIGMYAGISVLTKTITKTHLQTLQQLFKK